MATKNIYVSDADLGLFDEAARFEGSLSAAVVAGLRLYVARQRSKRERTQLVQIEVEVQEGPVVTTKRFTGRMLLRYEVRDGPRVMTFRVYETARGQIAVHIRNDPDWSALSSADEEAPVWSDEATWRGSWWETRERTLRVFPDLDAARRELPGEVVDAARAAQAEPETEDLDI